MSRGNGKLARAGNLNIFNDLNLEAPLPILQLLKFFEVLKLYNSRPEFDNLNLEGASRFKSYKLFVFGPGIT